MTVKELKDYWSGYNKGKQDALNGVLDIIDKEIEYLEEHLGDKKLTKDSKTSIKSWIYECNTLKKQIEEKLK